MKPILVKFAFFLNNSKRYKKIKSFFYNILENDTYKPKEAFDLFLIFLIVVSVGELLYGIKHRVPHWLHVLDFIAISLVFLVEYLLRFWVYSDLHSLILDEYEKSQFLKLKFRTKKTLYKMFVNKFKYVRSPTAIIDLISILPFYRELRILRIFKLLRYTKSLSQFVDVLRVKRFELTTLFLLFIFLIVLGSIAIYVFEGHVNKNLKSLFDAFYWALVTSATVGYGDITPVTDAGRVISMAMIIGGIIIMAFSTSVIVTAFYEKLAEIKESRIVDNMNKEKMFVIICGYGQMAKILLRQNNFNNKYVILEKDPKVTKRITKDGFNAITEDASRREVLAKFNLKYSKVSVICLGKSDVENVYITLNAKSLSRNIRVIARASSENMEKKLRLAGADHVVMPNNVANIMLLTAINQPAMYSVMHLILSGGNAAYMDEMTIFEHNELCGKKIKEINFKDKKLLLIGIERGDKEFVFNPPEDMIFQTNDTILIMGLRVSIEHFFNKYKLYTKKGFFSGK